MKSKTILILGGYGNTGILIAKLLLEIPSLKLILAGRNLEKAASAALKLKQQFNCDRVSALRIDASKRKSLREVFKQCDFVIVASSTAEYTENIIKTAVEIGIDYLDIQYSSKKIEIIKSLSSFIKNSNLCFITDAGFHPGLPAAIVRYAAKFFDNIEIAYVSSIIKYNWKKYVFSESTGPELLREFKNFRMKLFKDGNWHRVNYWDKNCYRKFFFGEKFGYQITFPMFLEEMKTIPEIYPSLKKTGFFIGGFNTIVDYVILPIIMFSIKIFPGLITKMSRFFFWGLKKFSKPPYEIILKIEAEGIKEGVHKKFEMFLSHADGYMLTAVSVVACIKQYLDHTARCPGLKLMAHAVDPERLIKDMEVMGIKIKYFLG